MPFQASYGRFYVLPIGSGRRTAILGPLWRNYVGFCAAPNVTNLVVDVYRNPSEEDDSFGSIAFLLHGGGLLQVNVASTILTVTGFALVLSVARSASSLAPFGKDLSTSTLF
jgi:hypothetical protein